MNISGVHIEKFSDGAFKSVTFDAKKHGEILKPILESLGILEDSRLQKKFYTLEEAKAETKKKISIKDLKGKIKFVQNYGK